MGPKTLPSGTPLMTDAQSDNVVVTRAPCILFDRAFLIQGNS